MYQYCTTTFFSSPSYPWHATSELTVYNRSSLFSLTKTSVYCLVILQYRCGSNDHHGHRSIMLRHLSMVNNNIFEKYLDNILELLSMYPPLAICAVSSDILVFIFSTSATIRSKYPTQRRRCTQRLERTSILQTSFKFTTTIQYSVSSVSSVQIQYDQSLVTSMPVKTDYKIIKYLFGTSRQRQLLISNIQYLQYFQFYIFGYSDHNFSVVVTVHRVISIDNNSLQLSTLLTTFKFYPVLLVSSCLQCYRSYLLVLLPAPIASQL